MAVVLEIRSATYAFDFLGSTLKLADGGFQLGPPPKKEIFRPAVFGSIPVSKEYSNRQVSITFAIKGASIAAIEEQINSLQEYLYYAWAYWQYATIGERIELRFRLHTGSSYYNHMPILSGEIYLPNNVMSVEQMVTTGADGDFLLKNCKIVLNCLPRIFTTSWIDGSLFAIGYNIIDNAWTATEDCTDTWTNVQLDGDMETPVSFWIENKDSVGTYEYKKFILGIGADNGNDYNDYVYEGEDGTAFNYSVTSTPSDSEMSGGNSRSLTYASSNWDSGINWAGLSGREIPMGVFRVFARFRTAVDVNTQYRLALRYYADANILTMGEIISPLNATTYVLDLGTFYNPPTLDPQIIRKSPAPLLPILYMSTTTGTSKTTDLDCIQFIPQDLGYRVYELPGRPLEYGQVLKDETWQGPNAVFVEDGSVEFNGTVKALYSPLYLPPRVAAIAHIIAIDTTGKARVDPNGLEFWLEAVRSYHNPLH